MIDPPAPDTSPNPDPNAGPEQGPTHTPAKLWPLYTLIALCTGIELVLQLSDLGALPSDRMRQSAYEYGGFWPGLLGNWRPNYAAQPYMMFLSYALLHGGLMHLVVNMLTLHSLGRMVLERVRNRGFILLYLAATLGGALCFGLLARTTQPMVGASGALFGLLGGILAWNYVDRFTAQRRLWPVWRVVLGLVALNLVLWWAMDGLLAWQTHLGGFAGGWVAALLIDPRSHHDPPSEEASEQGSDP